MHYAAMGSGPPVVLLHGWPGYWLDYRDVLPRVATFAHAIAPDFFGFGESGRAPAGAGAVDVVAAAGEEAFAGDVIELLNALSLDRVVLVGQDIGSAVAPAVARLLPERVRGLVLLNPTHPHIGDKRERADSAREAWYQHFHLLPLAEALIDGDRRRVATRRRCTISARATGAGRRPRPLCPDLLGARELLDCPRAVSLEPPRELRGVAATQL